MGKPCFSTITKFFAFALLGATTAIIAIAVLSTPAAAHSHNDGRGNRDALNDFPVASYGRWDQKGTGYAFARQRATTAYAGTGSVYAVAPAE